MRNKKGFVHFVEIIFTVLILSFIFTGFTIQKDTTLTTNQRENLRYQAWGTLDVLYELGLLSANIQGSNFTKVDLYIRDSLFYTQGYDWQFINTSGCHQINQGVLGDTVLPNCGSINASTKHDIVSAIYSVPSLNGTSGSIRLFLWDKL